MSIIVLPLSKIALQLEQRIRCMESILDESWLSRLNTLSLNGLNVDKNARSRLNLALFEHVCGPMPELPVFQTAVGQWCLLHRPELLARLCALALLGRPGVVRCCVQRQARDALRAFMGPAFDVLSQVATSGKPAHEQFTTLTPLAWACVGYMDLARRGLWPRVALRRMVRLSLPAAFPRFQGQRLPASNMDDVGAINAVESLFINGSSHER